MSKFEINRIIIELIRAILRFRFTSLLPKWQENNIQILLVSDFKDQCGSVPSISVAVFGYGDFTITFLGKMLLSASKNPVI